MSEIGFRIPHSTPNSHYLRNARARAHTHEIGVNASIRNPESGPEASSNEDGAA
jgi:hypothetical protein